MKKSELIADLASKVIKVIKEHPTQTLSISGDKEYSFTCLVEAIPNQFHEEDFSIRVVNEGLDTERAGYVGKQPPKLLSDLEVGLGLVLQADPNAKVMEQISEKMYKVRINGEPKLVTLTGNKTGVLLLPTE